MRSNPLAPRTVAKDQVVLHNVFALAETRVTRWLAEEKNPVFIQRGVGHADLATTMGYPHLVDGPFRPSWRRPSGAPPGTLGTSRVQNVSKMALSAGTPIPKGRINTGFLARRLMAGHRSLEPAVVVRIHPGQLAGVFPLAPLPTRPTAPSGDLRGRSGESFSVTV